MGVSVITSHHRAMSRQYLPVKRLPYPNSPVLPVSDRNEPKKRPLLPIPLHLNLPYSQTLTPISPLECLLLHLQCLRRHPPGQLTIPQPLAPRTSLQQTQRPPPH